MGALVLAQGGRPASPAGTAATESRRQVRQAGGADEPVYKGGKWIEITYGRPIKRGRDLWGSGADYGKIAERRRAGVARGRERLDAAQDRSAARHQRQDGRAGRATRCSSI